MVHGAGDNMTAAIRNDGFKGTATQEHDGCDHSDLPLVVPMGSALPIAIGAGRSSIRSHDRKVRAVEIRSSPVVGFRRPVSCDRVTGSTIARRRWRWEGLKPLGRRVASWNGTPQDPKRGVQHKDLPGVHPS